MAELVRNSAIAVTHSALSNTHVGSEEFEDGFDVVGAE
jgi:hypothetical protein